MMKPYRLYVYILSVIMLGILLTLSITLCRIYIFLIFMIDSGNKQVIYSSCVVLMDLKIA